ncbi:MAG TPA: endolytic transglycosylase MltG [Vicinamibacterales bacterium]|nr:endolytic transglycosylase MltG [Vicinamibacterales bacterium]
MKKAIAIVFAVAVIAGVGVAWTLYQQASEPFKGYAAAEQFVTIEPGSNTRTIGQRLIDAGVIRNDATFRASLWRSGRARGLQAGEFRFDRPMTPIEVIDKIARGDVYNRRLTFPEGLNIREMARIYEQQGFGKASAFMEAARDPAPIRDIDPAATDLEGYLFPETYSMPRDTTAGKLISLMVGRFRQLFTSDMQRAALALEMTPRQAVTLASLVEKETAQPSERPIVAAVYLNRLKIGMGMQADPTVIYALQRAGRYDGNLRRDDLSFDSPYNTYRYPGLPPGPIASPGLASLKAAVAPATVDYLYFVSRNDGSHVFARTLAEHNDNVRQFQVLYFRQQRAAERAAAEKEKPVER